MVGVFWHTSNYTSQEICERFQWFVYTRYRAERKIIQSMEELYDECQDIIGMVNHCEWIKRLGGNSAYNIKKDNFITEICLYRNTMLEHYKADGISNIFPDESCRDLIPPLPEPEEIFNNVESWYESPESIPDNIKRHGGDEE